MLLFVYTFHYHDKKLFRFFFVFKGFKIFVSANSTNSAYPSLSYSVISHKHSLVGNWYVHKYLSTPRNDKSEIYKMKWVKSKSNILLLKYVYVYVCRTSIHFRRTFFCRFFCFFWAFRRDFFCRSWIEFNLALSCI